MSRSSRALDLEGGAEVAVPAVQGIHEHEVDGKPNGAAPIRVPAKHAARRLGRLVSDAVGGVSKSQVKRLVFVLPRQRTNSVIAKELVRIQHSCQYPAQLLWRNH